VVGGIVVVVVLVLVEEVVVITASSAEQATRTTLEARITRPHRSIRRWVERLPVESIVGDPPVGSVPYSQTAPGFG
jgi:hypothetical protein